MSGVRGGCRLLSRCLSSSGQGRVEGVFSPGPLATFCRVGCAPIGTEVFPGSSGKMRMAIPRSCHMVRDLGAGRAQAISSPSLWSFYQDFFLPD